MDGWMEGGRGRDGGGMDDFFIFIFLFFLGRKNLGFGPANGAKTGLDIRRRRIERYTYGWTVGVHGDVCVWGGGKMGCRMSRIEQAVGGSTALHTSNDLLHPQECYLCIHHHPKCEGTVAPTPGPTHHRLTYRPPPSSSPSIVPYRDIATECRTYPQCQPGGGSIHRMKRGGGTPRALREPACAPDHVRGVWLHIGWHR